MGSRHLALPTYNTLKGVDIYTRNKGKTKSFLRYFRTTNQLFIPYHEVSNDVAGSRPSVSVGHEQLQRLAALRSTGCVRVQRPAIHIWKRLLHAHPVIPQLQISIRCWLRTKSLCLPVLLVQCQSDSM